MFFNIVLPAFILLSAVVDDLRSQKIHNILILVLLGVALISVLIFQGASGLFPALAKLVVSLGITVPLVLLKVIGGGDMKLYAVLSLVLSPRTLIVSLICAFFWGAILGLIKVILDKKMGLMYINFLSLLKFKKPSSDTLNTFPFSISLFLGWLSAFYF
ncbi:MAG: prepilin peptidase [Bdellovibrionales bacterium]|nr:prepilin peptidase [Bdellovibrionales bacterium]